MRIAYFATLRDVAGKREEGWDRPAATVGDLLRDLVAKYGPEFARWVFEQGELRLAIVLVNGRDVRGLQRLDTPLAPADTVTIFPPVGGG
ncbi:MAG TPA: ubiquitin-like small modifier protein 1 [Burkholderiales bacterium]|nr:ubiquitin-like small modifier protein 1 [Burkholderiales bacterium]